MRRARLKAIQNDPYGLTLPQQRAQSFTEVIAELDRKVPIIDMSWRHLGWLPRFLSDLKAELSRREWDLEPQTIRQVRLDFYNFTEIEGEEAADLLLAQYRWRPGASDRADTPIILSREGNYASWKTDRDYQNGDPHAADNQVGHLRLGITFERLDTDEQPPGTLLPDPGSRLTQAALTDLRPLPAGLLFAMRHGPYPVVRPDLIADVVPDALHSVIHAIPSTRHPDITLAAIKRRIALFIDLDPVVNPRTIMGRRIAEVQEIFQEEWSAIRWPGVPDSLAY